MREYTGFLKNDFLKTQILFKKKRWAHKKTAQIHLLFWKEKGKEGHLNSRFGSDPSGLLKPASFAETQAAKQSLSSKVIVNICQKKKIVSDIPCEYILQIRL